MIRDYSTLKNQATVNVFGFWSALLTAIFTIAFIIATFTLSPIEWQSMDALVTWIMVYRVSGDQYFIMRVFYVATECSGKSMKHNSLR